jgi:DNA-binding transcriptional ArsR family regulator
MLVLLRSGERSAGELAAPFEMTAGGVSQHLRVLEEAELVAVRREGKRRLYSLQPRALGEVVSWVDEFAAYFGQRLDALGAYLDRKHPAGPPNTRKREEKAPKPPR